MLVRLSATLCLSLSLSGAALAAEPIEARLEAVTGRVLVNQGDGFVAVKNRAALTSGAKIMVGDNSGAVLVFAATKTDEACRIELAPASVTRVTGREMCGESFAFAGAPVITPTASDAAPGGIPPAVVGIGFFTIAAGVGVARLFDDNKSVSAP